MKALQIDENKAKKLYKNASEEFKAMLEDTFSKDFFSLKVQDRIKSYEDACSELGIDPDDLPDTQYCQEEDQVSIIAYHKLIIIIRALNGGKNLKDNERWYYIWWYRGAADFGFHLTFNSDGNTHASVGPRLCFRTAALAEYCAKQFVELWKEYFLIK